MTDKLDDIIRKLSIQLTTETTMTGKVPEKLYEYENQATQALSELIRQAQIEELEWAGTQWLTGAARKELAKRIKELKGKI